MFSRPDALRSEIERALPDRPFELVWWDGVRTAATRAGGPTLTIRSPKALGHALRAPGQLGIGRAYVSGEIAVDDIDRAMSLLTDWQPPTIDGPTKRRLITAAVKAHGLTALPPVPESELRPEGRRHSIARDKRAVQHHYNVSNEFFALFLDASMTYSCGFFSRDNASLEAAQEAKLDLVCRKLDLQEGERVLDIGCGWGSFATHAASNYGVEVTAITLSPPQAEKARARAQEAGVGDRVTVHVMDWRELQAQPFDAISSIGMVEHVGNVSIDGYFRRVTELLQPTGRLLNHGIARLRVGDAEAGPFSERYVFPDAAPLHVSRIQAAVEHAGLVTDTIEGFGGDYAETLRHWALRLDEHRDEGERLVGPERMRIWRLYLRAARNGFATGFMGLYQVLAHRPGPTGAPAPPPAVGVEVPARAPVG